MSTFILSAIYISRKYDTETNFKEEEFGIEGTQLI